MNEKSAVGGGGGSKMRRRANTSSMRVLSASLRGGPALAARSAGSPRRPPERLNQPSTRSAKYWFVDSSRLEVIPPCEWPTSQKERMCAGTEALDHRLDQISEVLIVGLGRPMADGLLGGGRWGGDDQPVGVGVVVGGEVLALPGSDRPTAVEVEDEGHLLAVGEVGREVEVALPAGLLIYERLLLHVLPPMFGPDALRSGFLGRNIRRADLLDASAIGRL